MAVVDVRDAHPAIGGGDRRLVPGRAVISVVQLLAQRVLAGGVAHLVGHGRKTRLGIVRVGHLAPNRPICGGAGHIQ